MAKEYNVNKVSGVCTACGVRLEAGQEFAATLAETGEDFQRQDYCLTCWNDDLEKSPGVLAVWRGRVAQPQEKKKLFVDNDLLVSFFERLESAEDEAKISFRFVLALVLMRKKLLVYEGSRAADGKDVWRMRFRGSDRTAEVIDPHMDEQKIADVSQHLGEILEGEL